MHRIDVDAMLEEIDAELFQEWMLYDWLRPFGEDAADERFASLGMISLAKGGVKHPKKEHVLPWMKRTQSPKRRQTPAEMKAILNMAKKAAMGRGRRGKK